MKLRSKKGERSIRVGIAFSLLAFNLACFGQSLPTIEKTTNEILIISKKNADAKKIDNAELNQAIHVAKERRNTILSQIRTNPGRVMQFLLPERIYNKAPRSIQPYLEKEVTNIEGTLEIRAVLPMHKTEYIQYVFQTQNGIEYQIYFTDSIPSHFQTGAHFKLVHGFEIQAEDGSKVLIASSEDFVGDKIKSLAPLPNTFGQQKTIAILVNFQDQPNNRPWTLDQVKSVLASVNTNFNEYSFNQTSIAGTAVGWFVIPMNTSVPCSSITGQLPTLANDAATRAGVNLSQYPRRIYLFPRNNTCSWAGLGTVGGYPSKTWLNGYNQASTTGHELGHNLGLWHANLLKCSGGSTEGNCSVIEYGDRADNMGSGNISHWNAFAKERLGWLNYMSSPPIRTVTTSGNYVINPYELNNNLKALKILKRTLSNGSRDYYYLEFRQPVGKDSVLGTCGTTCDFTKGILFHLGNSTAANSCRLVDTTPFDNNPKIVALKPGATYKDPNAANGGLVVTVNSVSSTGANVNVKIGGLAAVCVHEKPTMRISPANTQWIMPGDIANFEINLMNNDNENCRSSRFTLASTHVNGMNETLNAKAIKLAPGRSEMFRLQVQTSKNMSTGIYSLEVSNANSDVPEHKGKIQAHIGIQ